MCPKAKSDQVITHRIELQKTERDMLEAAVMVNAVGKVGQAAGALIAPFAGGLTAIIVALIAKSELEDLLGWASRKFASQEQALAAEYDEYLAATERALNARDAAGNLMVPEGHPSRARPPMTRAEFDSIYMRYNQTNWDRVQTAVGEATFGYYGDASPYGGAPRSRRDIDESWLCKIITARYGRAAAVAEGVCSYGSGDPA